LVSIPATGYENVEWGPLNILVNVCPKHLENTDHSLQYQVAANQLVKQPLRILLKVKSSV